MVDYREILRLNSLKYSQHQIAMSVHSSRNTVREVLKRAEAAGVLRPLDEDVTNGDLESLLYPERREENLLRVEPDYSSIHKELAKSGVNLSLLWTEYCNEVRLAGKIPYMYSQFCDKYRKWARVTKATMRIQHKPGDKMEVDWAGTTIPYYDAVTHEEFEAYLFVAVLPCSCYVYAEACVDMKSSNWLMCHIHAYEFFGGVTRLLIPDNLRTGVTRNTRYETLINKSYYEMAEHYETAVVPARVEKPKDKSHAEGSVRFATTWIIAALRNRKFLSFEELTEAVSEKLTALNEMSFKSRAGNRVTAYLNEEKAFMKQLPAYPYEPAVWCTALVHNDYLITDGLNKYSVPFDLIGENVDIKLTKTMVEVYYHGAMVASHPRASSVRRDPIVKIEHMPEAHKKYLNYNSEAFLKWSSDVGDNTVKVVEYFLGSGREPEEGYKACVGLSKLGDRYGHTRLENACAKMMDISNEPTLRNISTMLKHGQDRVPVEKVDHNQKHHGITRGAEYFRKGGNQ